MGITKEQFSTLVKGMKAVYSTPSFIPDKFAFGVWYGLLSDLDYETLNKAIQRYMTTVNRIPTPADIRGMVTKASDPGLSEQNAFAFVRKAVQNSTYNSDAEFDKLPEVIKVAVGNPANLREWASMDNEEFETVQQSQFLRAYRTALERRRTDETLPNALRIGSGSYTAQIGVHEAKQIEVKSEGVPMPDRVKERLLNLYGKS